VTILLSTYPKVLKKRASKIQKKFGYSYGLQKRGKKKKKRGSEGGALSRNTSCARKRGKMNLTRGLSVRTNGGGRKSRNG